MKRSLMSRRAALADDHRRRRRVRWLRRGSADAVAVVDERNDLEATLDEPARRRRSRTPRRSARSRGGHLGVPRRCRPRPSRSSSQREEYAREAEQLGVKVRTADHEKLEEVRKQYFGGSQTKSRRLKDQGTRGVACAEDTSASAAITSGSTTRSPNDVKGHGRRRPSVLRQEQGQYA